MDIDPPQDRHLIFWWNPRGESRVRRINLAGGSFCVIFIPRSETQLRREKIINKTEKNPTSHTEQIFGIAEHAFVVLLAITVMVKIIFIFEQHETFTDINSWRRSCFEYHCYFGSCTESLSRFKIQWHIAFKELVRELNRRSDPKHSDIYVFNINLKYKKIDFENISVFLCCTRMDECITISIL